MIKYYKGDLLESGQRIIVQQVNCQGVMGSGFAKAVRDWYPEVYRQYAVDFRLYELGEVLYISVEDDQRLICNLFGQDEYLPRDIRHTNYEALYKGFEDIKSRVTEDISLPKLGCHLGGGDWRIVSTMLEIIFTDRDVHVYELE